MRASGLVRSPLLIAIILSATGLGIILPILKDAGETETPFGRVLLAGASIAEVAPIVLLSLFFSRKSGGRLNRDETRRPRLFEHSSTLARVPVFLAALLLVRGLPALLYRPFAGYVARSSALGCCRRPRSASPSSQARLASHSA